MNETKICPFLNANICRKKLCMFWVDKNKEDGSCAIREYLLRI